MKKVTLTSISQDLVEIWYSYSAWGWYNQFYRHTQILCWWNVQGKCAHLISINVTWMVQDN